MKPQKPTFICNNNWIYKQFVVELCLTAFQCRNMTVSVHVAPFMSKDSKTDRIAFLNICILTNSDDTSVIKALF